MSENGFTGELAAICTFWFSHLLLNVAIRKYKHKRKIEKKSVKLPINGTLLIRDSHGELISVTNDISIINYEDDSGIIQAEVPLVSEQTVHVDEESVDSDDDVFRFLLDSVQ